MGFFQDSIRRFAPGWFQEPNMRTFLRSVGGVLDDFSQRVFDGRRSAIPYAAGAKSATGVLLECDEDVLPWHSADRGIRIYDSEPLLSRRYRLSRWRQLKKRRGSHLGELENFQPFWLAEEFSVLPTVRIVHQDNAGSPSSVWYTLNPQGALSVNQRITSNWNYRDVPANRTDFWVIIHLPPGYSSAIVYDDGSSVYEGGAIYDGVTTIAIRDIVDAILEAKAAHSHLSAIISTELQPTQVIPGGSGNFPFNPTSTAVTMPDGSTTLPVGNWNVVLDPITNLPTRPAFAKWLYEDPS